MTWYFHKLGQIKKIDQHGNRGKGKWTINEEGELCVEFKRGGERCRTVAPRTDGGYDIYGTEYPEEEELKWIFNQVLPGNPHDLLGFTYCITVLNTKPTGVYAQCPPMTAKPTGRAVSNEIHHFRTS